MSQTNNASWRQPVTRYLEAQGYKVSASTLGGGIYYSPSAKGSPVGHVQKVGSGYAFSRACRREEWTGSIDLWTVGTTDKLQDMGFWAEEALRGPDPDTPGLWDEVADCFFPLPRWLNNLPAAPNNTLEAA